MAYQVPDPASAERRSKKAIQIPAAGSYIKNRIYRKRGGEKRKFEKRAGRKANRKEKMILQIGVAASRPPPCLKPHPDL